MLVLGAVAPAEASLGSATADARKAPGTSAAHRPLTVTLLTGDRVTLPSPDAGSGSVRPGAGRDHIHFIAKRERGELYVIPSDAQRLLNTGKLDRRLFNVTGLIRAGYHDAARDNLPLIVTYDSGAARRATATFTTAGARVTRDLPAIDGAAVAVGKDVAGTFWTAVTSGGAGARTATAGGVERIWLDGKRQLLLDHSVPQIGAPAAHAAGYTGKGVTVAVLDTGVDADHPDLAGKVADARNFTEDSEPGDVVGHGTHVAATIAGSGAASGGKYRGVAPDATLLSGKVCEPYWCTESAILAGMEWAAVEKRATVINLSLGGYDGPEIDPLEEAVNTLTAQTGTLFVIAAGNAGDDETVGSPGSADAALTVGAVDRDDALADFSSRGPRTGDDAIKPDITAPGVDIVAAQAAGTELGDPVAEGYVALSGTSMATPHVTGAVALLAQQHPDWSASQFKATLMASARPNPELTAYQQGAGRVDVARAIEQTVTSDPVSLSFGRTVWPHDDDEPVTRTVTYRNPGATALTLDLALRVTGPEQAEAPTGMFQISAEQVTVPAGGTAAVTVTVDTSVSSPDGYWSGQLVATGGDTTVVTPLAVNKEVESYNLSVTHIDVNGAPSEQYYSEALNLDNGRIVPLYGEDSSRTVRLPKGRYGLIAYLDTPRGEDEFDTAMLVQPELELAGDRSVSFDARRARPVSLTVPDRSASVGLAEVTANFFAFPAGIFGYSLIATSFEGVSSAQIGPGNSGEKFLGAIGGQWAKLGAERAPVAHSPYLYSVRQTFPGRLPTGYRRDYGPGDLATVRHEFVDRLRPGEGAERVVFGIHDSGDSGWAIGLPTTVPSRRTEYYNSGSGLGWSGELWIGPRDDDGWLEPDTALISAPTAYRKGRQYQERWNGAPYGVSFESPHWSDGGLTRRGDTLLLNVSMYGDAAGHIGFSQTDTARTALYRNGVLVGEEPEAGWGLFEVPPEPARYRLETSATRSNRDLTSRISVTWTFRSGHVEGEEPARLPAMVVRFAPRLDADNAAPAGRSFTIPVTVERQPGAPEARVKSLTVEVSYDDGRTWKPATLQAAGADRAQWTAQVRHPAGAKYVSLRTKATDTAGSTVSQTVIRAYRLA